MEEGGGDVGDAVDGRGGVCERVEEFTGELEVGAAESGADAGLRCDGQVCGEV